MGFKRPQVRLLSLGPVEKRYPLGYLFFAFTAFFAGNRRNLRPLVYCIFGRRPQARECAAAAGSTPVTRTLLSENRICGFLRQRSPGLRAGFAVFLRKSRRVMEFFPGACPWKNNSIKKKSGCAGLFGENGKIIRTGPAASCPCGWHRCRPPRRGRPRPWQSRRP